MINNTLLLIINFHEKVRKKISFLRKKRINSRKPPKISENPRKLTDSFTKFLKI